MQSRYPLAGNLPALREERAWLERCREAIRPTYPARLCYARVDADLAFNAKLIREAELATLGHLATDGAWLT